MAALQNDLKCSHTTSPLKINICNFMLCDLLFSNISSKAPFFVSLHEVTFGRLLNIPGIVKLWESPRQSRGFT